MQKQTSIGKFFKKLVTPGVEGTSNISDMEDIGRLVPLKKTSLISQIIPESPKIAEVIPPFCPITTDTMKWLEFAKYTWAGQLAERKRKSDITVLLNQLLSLF